VLLSRTAIQQAAREQQNLNLDKGVTREAEIGITLFTLLLSIFLIFICVGLYFKKFCFWN
jgi:hypothetical protein